MGAQAGPRGKLKRGVETRSWSREQLATFTTEACRAWVPARRGRQQSNWELHQAESVIVSEALCEAAGTCDVRMSVSGRLMSGRSCAMINLPLEQVGRRAAQGGASSVGYRRGT